MRKLAFVVLVVGVVWWWRGGDTPRAVHATRPQAAVLADGFAMLVGHDARRVIEMDRQGAKLHEMPLGVDAADVRLVGTRAGTAVGYRVGKKIELALLDSDGNVDEKWAWGKKAVALCQGAATNEYRFGVGWLESDGRVWFVHGPMKRALGDVLDVMEVETSKVSWCGIASAEQNVMLFWRDGSRLMMNVCGEKKCTDLVVKVPVDPSETLVAFGCVRDACLLATRDKQGTTRLHRVTDRGRAIVKTLEHATPDTAISIANVGSRAFAVGYMAKDGLATVHRVTTDLAFTHVWHFEGVQEAPSLASAGERVLVALSSGDAHVLTPQR